MKRLGLGKILTDTFIYLNVGDVVHINEYEVGDESDSKDCLTEEDFNMGHSSFCATVYVGIGNRCSVSYDIDEHEFELIDNAL